MNAPSRRLRRFQAFRVDSLEDRSLLNASAFTQAVPAIVQAPSQSMLLKGNFKGTAQVTPTGMTTANVVSTGVGKFSGLGNSTVMDTHTVNFISQSSAFISNGVTTITGANGDKLVLDYTGTSQANGFGGFNDTYNFTVDGANSTGSFAGATGSGVIHVQDLRGGSLMTGFPFAGDVNGQITKNSPPPP